MTENMAQLAVSGVQGLRPYQAGKPVDELERELGIRHIIKLASNENPLGPSSRVLDAVRSHLADLARYPDGSGFRLKKALAGKLSVAPGQITLANGSSEVLGLIASVFLSAASRAVYSEHAFAMYPIVVQAVGARAAVAPASTAASGQRYGHDLDAMLALVDADTRVVFIANPNNPTGTYLSDGALDGFLSELPKSVLCVVDEAYFEYVGVEDYPNTIEWLNRYRNLIVTRTFSKAYGLAGLRVGYSVSHPEIADLLNRLRQPFNVNTLALIAAEAALDDDEHVSHSKAVNAAGLQQLAAAFEARGLEYIPSVANFVTVDVKRPAAAVYERLLHQGIIVRPVENYDLPGHLRVTVGTEKENRSFINALDCALADD
jgi:histidinol-phosphate aminotransferase